MNMLWTFQDSHNRYELYIASWNQTQLYMSVFFWYLVKIDAIIRYYTVVYTEQVTFSRYQKKKRKKKKKKKCVTGHTVFKIYVMIYETFFVIWFDRVICFNFDTMPQLRQSRFRHFVDAVGMLRKNISHHSKANIISNRKYIHNRCKLFFTCKNLYYVNDEVREYYPIWFDLVLTDISVLPSSSSSSSPLDSWAVITT